MTEARLRWFVAAVAYADRPIAARRELARHLRSLGDPWLVGVAAAIAEPRFSLEFDHAR